MRGETRKGCLRGCCEGVVERPKGGVVGGIEQGGVFTLWLDGLLAGLLETTFVER